MAGKIDTHHHFLPRAYVDVVGVQGLASVTPDKKSGTWSAETSLAMMEAYGIDEAILSIPMGNNSGGLARACNEEAARLRGDHPGRFGSFVTLPMPDIDAALAEIAYGLDVLNADGVILVSNYGGKYLGDPMFAPAMEELNARKAVAFIHPISPPYQLDGLPPAGVIEFPFDTTRTAASLIFSGAHKRWPEIKFILSHAGGTLPFLASRLLGSARMNPQLAERVGDPAAALRHFWYDTALAMSQAQIAALSTVADPAKITFGTDFPLAPAFMIEASVKDLGRIEMPETLRANIGRANAERLLGRV